MYVCIYMCVYIYIYILHQHNQVYVAGETAAVVHRPSVSNDLGINEGLARFSRVSSDVVAKRMKVCMYVSVCICMCLNHGS